MAALMPQEVVTSRSTPFGRTENHLVNQLLGTVAAVMQNNNTPYQNMKVCLPLDTSDPVIHHPNISILRSAVFIAVDTETSITETQRHIPEDHSLRSVIFPSHFSSRCGCLSEPQLILLMLR